MRKSNVFKDEKAKFNLEVAKRISANGDCTPEHRVEHVENWVSLHDSRLIDDVIKEVRRLSISNRSAAEMRNAVVDMLRENYLE